ncbi:phage distal tail protein [Salininema proteolyticum]|uniref:Phage tail family protein n=1 Tax=Salininema proteolyticum TaxID=1607685 RepID=A0ABV8TYZ1_9ACTN
MSYLMLVNDSDRLSLGGIASDGTGIEVGPGAGGLGLPPVATQWVEGAGDGALYRGRRILPRDIDLPLQILGQSPEDLRSWLRVLERMLAGPAELRWMLPSGEYWKVDVVHTGGGDWATGQDTTGRDWLHTMITLRAGEPYWTYSRTSHVVIKAMGGRGLLGGSLVSLQVSSSQAQGEVALVNDGSAPSWPVWEVTGPASNLSVSLEGKTGFDWNGTLGEGERLVIDAKAKTVTDSSGASRYASMSFGPDLFSLPPGRSHITIGLDNVTTDSLVVCKWRKCAWSVL